MIDTLINRDVDHLKLRDCEIKKRNHALIIAWCLMNSDVISWSKMYKDNMINYIWFHFYVFEHSLSKQVVGFS